jgi:hypothetical protein
MPNIFHVLPHFDSYQDKENAYQDSCFSSFVVETNTMAKEICKNTDFLTILFQEIHNFFTQKLFSLEQEIVGEKSVSCTSIIMIPANLRSQTKKEIYSLAFFTSVHFSNSFLRFQNDEGTCIVGDFFFFSPMITAFLKELKVMQWG